MDATNNSRIPMTVIDTDTVVLWFMFPAQNSSKQRIIKFNCSESHHKASFYLQIANFHLLHQINHFQTHFSITVLSLPQGLH